MGKNQSSLYYVLIHYLYLGKNPRLLGINLWLFGKKSLSFGKKSLTFGKKSLTFGKKITAFWEKIPDLWKKTPWLLGTNKIPPYFFAQYIISTWEESIILGENSLLLGQNSPTPEIPYFWKKNLTFRNKSLPNFFGKKMNKKKYTKK